MAATIIVPKAVILLVVCAGALAWPVGLSFLGPTSAHSSTTPRSEGSGSGFGESLFGALGHFAGRRTTASLAPNQQKATTPIGIKNTTPVKSTTTSTTPAEAPTTPSTTTTSQASSPQAETSTLGTSPDISERSGATSKTELEICQQNWQNVGNETVNNSIDVFPILLDYGGVPGQIAGGNNWTRNSTNPKDPNQPDTTRWTYFYGKTDYKTFIRVERGSVHSAEHPGQRTPEEVQGDIWWVPEDFCGKLRHAKYHLNADPELTDEVCWISNGKLYHTKDFNCIEIEDVPPGKGTCGRGGINGALMASLVG